MMHGPVNIKPLTLCYLNIGVMVTFKEAFMGLTTVMKAANYVRYKQKLLP